MSVLAACGSDPSAPSSDAGGGAGGAELDGQRRVLGRHDCVDEQRRSLDRRRRWGGRDLLHQRR